MKNFIKNMRSLLRASNKTLYLRRKSRIIIGRAFQKLDKSKLLGENVPYTVLEHFSKDGV